MRQLPWNLIALTMLAATALSTSPAAAVVFDWVTVEGADVACDSQPDPNPILGTPGGCFGRVTDTYRISETEVTNAQYVEFLNAVDPNGDNALSLYSSEMSSDSDGGITLDTSGPAGLKYLTRLDFDHKPVNHVAVYDALRFANWLHNGQGSGDTETGAYTITPLAIFLGSVTRNAEATIFLPSEDEWYKAAYYDAVSTSYLDYPTGSDTQTICDADTTLSNAANCDSALTDVGAYAASPSPAGTFDQGGTVYEWNDTILGSGPIDGSAHGLRGGAFFTGPLDLAASFRLSAPSNLEASGVGFRVASLPEPGTVLLQLTGLLGLAWRCRRRA